MQCMHMCMCMSVQTLVTALAGQLLTRKERMVCPMRDKGLQEGHERPQGLLLIATLKRDGSETKPNRVMELQCNQPNQPLLRAHTLPVCTAGCQPA